MAGLLTAFAPVCALSGTGLVSLLQRLPGDGHAGERRRIEEAALQPDRAHFRPIEGPLPAAARRGTTYVPIYSTLYLGERETQVGLG